jgi:hypothetical protein
MADPTYGSEVAPNPPVDDMYAIDQLAGQFDADRDSSPASFTGGMGGAGLGGTAEPAPEGGPMKQRIGY